VIRDVSNYFAAFFFAFASARRSVFFRRRARFLALSLPLLCPISLNPRVVCSTTQQLNSLSAFPLFRASVFKRIADNQ